MNWIRQRLPIWCRLALTVWALAFASISAQHCQFPSLQDPDAAPHIESWSHHTGEAHHEACNTVCDEAQRSVTQPDHSWPATDFIGPLLMLLPLMLLVFHTLSHWRRRDWPLPVPVPIRLQFSRLNH
ncbi:hypothetical protein [Chromobacterium violaceum]|uniref:Copper resistance protein n=2 Tax=Chromobacterium violaceum TaxID=536 RepID=Q7NT49_CHRVO|nr:hypothetical protein [Chromobacterium violaceum]AAQ60879.1 hypothetical protein CV_3213 [Chromobacterium violaceum ATCC 12472]KMN47274.1 hypothetical protein VK93_21415 [Chromobacterium violaceum]KMN85998.1 hypothetical protein VL02_11610 [Chromobacterium violaceum]KMN88381.1 hypothetical protein VL04_21045 [Chromobacterium violaceum]KMO02832.1 hypothetical protein VL16_16450 [Chromobacterium violaceum]